MTLEEMLQKAREYAALAEKATPGPWVLEEDHDGRIVRSPKAEAEVVGDIPGVVQHYLADLNLIAAAPEIARLLTEFAGLIAGIWEPWEVRNDGMA